MGETVLGDLSGSIVVIFASIKRKISICYKKVTINCA